MAADTTTQVQDVELNQSGSGKPDSNEIKIREAFEIGGEYRIIYDIAVDRGIKRTSGWRIREKSLVEVFGSGLGIYDQVNLIIDGSVYQHKNVSRIAGGRQLSFVVSDQIEDLYADGTRIIFELVSNANRENNRYLKQRFSYRGLTEEEKKQKKKTVAEEKEAKSQQAGSTGAAEVSQIINSAAGAAGVDAAGTKQAVVNSAAATGTKNEAVSARADGAEDFFDDDVDEGGAETSEASGEIINNSTLSQSSVGTQMQSPSGTVSQTKAVSGASSGTVSSSVSAQTSGTVSGGQTISSSGTVSAGGRVNVSQNVSGSVSGTQSISSRQSANISSSGQVSAGGTVSGGGSIAQSQTVSASGTTNASQNISASGQELASSTGKISTGVQGSQAVAAAAESKATQQVTAEGEKTVNVNEQNNLQVNNEVKAGEQVEEKSKAGTSAEGQTEVGLENKDGSKNKTQQTQASEKGVEKADEKENKTEAKKEPTKAKEAKPSESKKTTPKFQGGSTATLGAGFGLSGGTPVLNPSISGTLNKFKANQAALNSRLGVPGTSPAPVQPKSGIDKSPKNSSLIDAAAGKKPETAMEEDKAGENIADPAVGKPLMKEGLGEGGPNPEQTADESSAPTTEDESKNQIGKNQLEEDGDKAQENLEEQEEPVVPLPASQAATTAAKETAVKEAVSAVNVYINTFLTEAAIWVWATAIPSIGTTVLLGAIVGDFLWAFKKTLVKRAIRTTMISKIIVGKEFDADKIADQVKFSTAVKANIAAMNAAVIGILIAMFMSIGAFLYIGCQWPSEKASALGAAGFSDVCKSFMEFSQGISGGLKGEVSSLPTGSTGTPAAGNCSPLTSGIASVSNLSTTCFGNNAATASIIAAHESGGNPAIGSTVDVCRDSSNQPIRLNGQVVRASWGLFQINITAHPIGSLNCPKAFDKMYTAQNHQCQVLDPALYTACVAAATTASVNIQTACNLSKNGTSWGPWLADIKACNLTTN